jgi:hypothetical protein
MTIYCSVKFAPQKSKKTAEAGVQATPITAHGGKIGITQIGEMAIIFRTGPFAGNAQRSVYAIE